MCNNRSTSYFEGGGFMFVCANGYMEWKLISVTLFAARLLTHYDTTTQSTIMYRLLICS